MEALNSIISQGFSKLTEIHPHNHKMELLDHGQGRIYPLMNHTALLNLTPEEFIRPGLYGVQQSTLPFFQVLLNVAAFIVWIIVFLYFWKIIYYQVDDPYATPGGSAPPNYRMVSDRLEDFWDQVSQAIDAW